MYNMQCFCANLIVAFCGFFLFLHRLLGKLVKCKTYTNEKKKENFSYEDDLVVAPYDAHELECVGN